MARPRVLIQAGHSAAYPPYLLGGGGAPSEAEWTAKLASLVEPMLEASGVDVTIVGAWLVYSAVVPPPAVVEEDYDLFLAFHYDAAVYAGSTGNTGGFCDRASGDPMGAVADRFITRFNARYFPVVGIRNATERRNDNTRDYYAFRYTSAQTPGVIIEFGVGQPGVGGDAPTLWEQTDRIAGLVASAVVSHLIAEGAMDVDEPEPEPEPAPEPEPVEDDYAERVRQSWLDRLGADVPINPDTAIVKRALEAALVGEWRGPFRSDEYPAVAYDDGEATVRQDQSAGILEYRPSTGAVNYVEVVDHPEALQHG